MAAEPRSEIVTPPASTGEAAIAIDSRDSRFFYGYWLVGAAFIAQFVSVGSQNYVVGAFFKPMTTDLGWTRSQFTLASTVGQFVMAFTGFFIGAYVDRNGGRRLMAIGIVVLSSALYGLSFTEQLSQWLVLNGIALTTGAALIGMLVVNVTLSKWFVARRGMAIGISSMGVSLAGVLLTPIMTWAIDEYGWRVGWRILAIGAAALIIPVTFLMRRGPEHYGLRPDGLSVAQAAGGEGTLAAADFSTSLTRRMAMHAPAFYLLILAFGMFGATIGVMLLQTIPFMTDAGYSRTTASGMITLSSIPALMGKPFWGILIDRMNAQRLASASALVTGIAMLMITVSVRSTTDPFVYVGFVLLGLGWGGMIPLQEVIWATFFGRRFLGAVRSASMPFSLLLGAGTPLVVSIYFDKVGNYDGALLAIAVLNIVAAALMLTIRKPARPEQ